MRNAFASISLSPARQNAHGEGHKRTSSGVFNADHAEPKKPKLEHIYISSDDELPDLDEPMTPKCTCHKTCGETVLMCTVCRLTPMTQQVNAKKDRHFLDVVFANQYRHKVMCTENTSDVQSDDSLGDLPDITDSDNRLSTVKNLHTTDVKHNFKDRNSSRSKPNHVRQSHKTRNIRARNIRGKTKNVDNALPVDYRMVSQMLSQTPSFCSVPLHPDLQMVFGNTLPKPHPVVKISDEKQNIIEGEQEETDACKGLVSLVLKRMNEYTTMQCEPPAELVHSLFKTLLHSDNIDFSYSIYRTLNMIFKLHPPLGPIPFKWSDLQMIITELRLPYGVKNIPTHKAISNILALRTIVLCLETELRNRSLAAQIRVIKSTAYQWVSTDLVFAHIKELIQWISLALRFGDFEDHIYYKQHDDEDIPKVLPCLQQLLDMSLVIAKRPDDSARRISRELIHMFRCLPSLEPRRLFLTTIASPLLKFTLCQQLLEDQCGADSCGALCLQDVLQASFTAVPPRNSLTPPPTPSDDDDDDDENGGHRQQKNIYQDESCEELALLLLTVVTSYLATAKAKLQYPLWKRVLDQPDEVLNTRDMKSLKLLPDYVTRLRRRIESTQMSIRTNLYLVELESLSDAQ